MEIFSKIVWAENFQIFVFRVSFTLKISVSKLRIFDFLGPKSKINHFLKILSEQVPSLIPSKLAKSGVRRATWFDRAAEVWYNCD